MTRLVLIRHGETDWNVEGRYQGQADPPLNHRGLNQAHELAEELFDAKLDLIFTSPLKRAHQTASILSQRLKVAVYIDERLMEIDQGDWQSRLRSEIEKLYPDVFKRWETEPWEVTPPGGEHLEQVQARVFAAVDDIVQQYRNLCVGIVTHRIPIALIKMRYQELDTNIVRTLHLPNTYIEEILV